MLGRMPKAARARGRRGERVPALGPNLREMVWPLAPDDFLRRYWNQRHFASHGPATRAEPIFRALGVRSIEQYLERRRDDVQIWYQTQERDQVTLAATASEALSLYRAGLTVYVNGVEELRPWKAALGRQLGFEDTGAAALFGARRGAGTPWHFDRLENFTVQLAGEKTWRVAANTQVPHPLKNWVTREPIGEELRTYVTEILPRTAPPGRAETVTLEPGSMLYLPRGYWHTAEASSRESLSVTFLFVPTTWASRLVAALLSQLTALPAWREHTGELLGDRRDDARAREKIAGLLADLRAVVGRMSPEDLVPDEAPPPRITAGTRLARNPLAFLTVEGLDGGTQLVRITVQAARPGSSTLEIEAALAPVCLFVSRRTGPFLASEAAAAAPRVPFRRVAALLRVLWEAQVLRGGPAGA
jgi:50S ribosomal protein L16 3-hydroxylase